LISWTKKFGDEIQTFPKGSDEDIGERAPTDQA